MPVRFHSFKYSSEASRTPLPGVGVQSNVTPEKSIFVYSNGERVLTFRGGIGLHFNGAMPKRRLSNNVA